MTALTDASAPARQAARAPQPVGVAVVGAGFMAGVHSTLFEADPRSRVRWVVDIDARAGEVLAATTGGRATTELDEALADDEVQLVVIATPPPTHEPIAARTLEAGRHVLVEKPMVLTSRAAVRLGEMARRRGIVLAYGGNFVYAPKFVRAQQLAGDAAAMGDLHSVRVVFRIVGPDTEAGLTRAVAGEGALTDIGWHAIELCRFLLGKPDVQAVTASVQPGARDGDGELRGVVLLHFANGVTGQCDVSWLWPGQEQVTLEVAGTRGTVAADLWQGMGLAAYSNGAFADVWEPNSGFTFPEWEWIRNSGYEHQDRHVLDAVIDGVPLANGAGDAAAILTVLEAAFRSANEKRTVLIHG
jgi:predicted dehydrogenase